MKDEYRGQWWLPAKPDARVHGTLRFSTSDLVLDLDGTLGDTDPFVPTAFNPDIIQGQSLDGTNVTLYKCYQIQVGGNLSSGLTASKMLVQVAFLGAHFNTSDDIAFSRVDVRFKRLDEWVRLSGFDVKHQASTTTISYSPPARVIASLDDLQMSLAFSESDHFDLPRIVSIQQDAFFQIETPHETSFERLDALAYHLQDFFSLALEEGALLEEMRGYSDRYTMEFQGKKIHEPITIVFPIRRTGSTHTRARMLFDFGDIRTRFDVVLKNWFAKTEMLEPILLGYFAPLRFPGMYLEQKFLGYTQAIESYHRRALNGHGIPQEDYAKIIPEIKKCIPPEHLEWFSEKLDYNEPSQRHRLKALMDRFSWIDFGGKEFVNKVVVTRNYLTHFDKHLKDDAASGEGLLKLTLKLELLIKMVLLSELALEQTQIEAMIKKTDAYHALFR